MAMKHLMFLCAALVLHAAAIGQSSDTSSVGKIVYYEGKVELGTDPKWSGVRINTVVRKNQFIRTTGDAVAEIVWSTGTKSIVGPNSRISIQSLFAGSAGTAKAKTEGTFNNFKTMFNTASASKRTEEGGIRRSREEVQKKPGNEDVYWKQDKEISFTEAFSLYEGREFNKAIPALQAFLNQKPGDEMARYAAFALGHSYIMSNNTVKAKEIFERIVLDYSGDPLQAEAQKILAEL
jgi:TolA-binding protein